jgi:hypothetical protein
MNHIFIKNTTEIENHRITEREPEEMGMARAEPRKDKVKKGNHGRIGKSKTNKKTRKFLSLSYLNSVLASDFSTVFTIISPSPQIKKNAPLLPSLNFSLVGCEIICKYCSSLMKESLRNF